MINKYAEIKDRLVLYNACKGILRVKMAEGIASNTDTGTSDLDQQRLDSVQNGDVNSLMNTFDADGNDVNPTAIDDDKYRIGLSGAGAAGGLVGAGGGYLASDWAANKLGLTADRGGWRKWLGYGLRTAGTIGGAVGGYALGDGLSRGMAKTDAAYNAAKEQEAANTNVTTNNK